MWSDNDQFLPSNSTNRRRNNDRDDITLANTQGQLHKVTEQLNAAKQALADATNKIHNEESRCVQLEEQLRKRTEEFRQEQLLRVNQETALHQANARAKEAETSRKHIEQQLDVLGSTAASNRQQQDKYAALQKQFRDLQVENARLHNNQTPPPPPRPPSSMARGRPSTASSIPIPKGKQSRASSLTPELNTRRLEDDLRATRATLASTESALRTTESKLTNTADGLLKAENEKFALEKRFAAERAELQFALEEAQDELRFARQTVDTGVSREEYERALKAEDAVRTEIAAIEQRNRELESKLQRKTDQLASAQERMDELQFQDPLIPRFSDDIEEALEEARNEAARAKEELVLFKANVKDITDSRESLGQIHQTLQDKDKEVEAQREKNIQLINEKECTKNMLTHSEHRREEAEANLASARDQIETLQRDLAQCESSLRAARLLADQHRTLWQDTDRACTTVEKRAAELEAQLDKLREEFADRSTISEAHERNRQWMEAVERVQILEGELQLAQRQQDEDKSAPKMKSATLLPPESNEEEVEVLERLLAAVDRLRGERDQLRCDVAFLRAEAKAIENALDATVEEHRQMDLQRIKAVERELETVKAAVLEKGTRIAELTSESALEQQRARYLRKAVEALATTVQQFDFVIRHSSVDTSVSTPHAAPLINIDHSIHSLLFASQRPTQPLADESSGSWLAESALQQPMQVDRAFTIHEDAPNSHSGSSSAAEDEDQCMAYNFDPQPVHNSSPPRARSYSPSAAAKYIEELELRVDRRTEQIGIHQHEIRRLQTNLQIAEEAIDSMRSELEVLRSERACLEEDAHRVRESWAFDKQALEKVDAELDEVNGDLERRGTELLKRDGEIVEVLKVLFDGICKRRLAIATVGHLRQEIRAIRAALEEQTQQVQSREREARRLSSLNKLANVDARGRERELEDTVSQLKGEVQELHGQLQNARDSFKTSETLVADLESRLQVAEQTHKNILRGHEQAVEALNVRLVEAETISAAASDARGAAEGKHAVLLREIEEVKAALEAAQEHPATKELEERLVSEETRRVELKEQLETEKEGAIILQAEVRRLKEEIQRQSELDQELDEMVVILNHERQAYGSLENEFNALEAKHTALSEEFKEARARFERCEAELTEKRAALEAAELRSSDVALLQAQVNGLRKELAQSEEALFEAQQAASAAASTTVCDAEANVRIVQLERQIEQLQEEAKQLEGVCQYKSTEIDQAEDRIMEGLQERRKLSNKVDSLSRKLRDATRTIEELQLARPSAALPAPTNDGPEPRPIVDKSAGSRVVSVEVRRPSSSQVQRTTSSEPTKAPSESFAPSMFSPLVSNAPTHRQAAASTTRPIGSPPEAKSPKPADMVAPSQALPSTISAEPIQVPLPLSRENSASPQHPVQSTTPGSAGRKRRLPDDFDPNPEERLPPAPVLASATPSRLRRAMLRDGTVPRNGFTPSRTRTTSTTASDRDAAITAANAAWVVNMGVPPVAPALSLGGDKYPAPSTHDEDIGIPQDSGSAVQSSKVFLMSKTSRPRSRVATNKVAVYSASALTSSGEQPARSSKPIMGKPRTGGWLRGVRENKSGPSGANAVASSDSDAKASSSVRRAALSSLNLGLGVGELGVDIPARKADGAPGYTTRTKSRRLE